nr:glycosyltransferase family 2 protein [Nocardioides perillae]
MPPAPQPSPAWPSVGVVLVSRDGARWLPATLAGLAEQSVAPAHVRAVDAGSKDATPDLLREALGPEAVLAAPGSAGFPTSVRLAVEALPPTEWVWLLHDDARPAPDALERLLSAAAADPGAAVLGPKLREWPSLRRLLELGVTISGTGRRETGLERGEYDQGQHDDVREVLAVNTAGMLVRRSVWDELDGLDEQLPVFGNDLDLGWRTALAGHRTLVVPTAVVFHAEAAHRGVRRTPLTGRHTHYAERRAALWTLLANGSARSLPWRVLRLTLGTLLRVLGFLLVRAVGQALDELAALVSVLSRPGELRRARRRRRAAREARAAGGAPAVAPGDVRRLLAPWWLPYRHGLDAVSDVVAAATVQAQDVAERRRAAAAAERAAQERAAQERAAVRAGAPPRAPVPGGVVAGQGNQAGRVGPSGRSGRSGQGADEEDALLAQDGGLLARVVTDPVAVVLAVGTVLLLVGAADAFGVVDAPGLPPAPAAVGDWWALHAASTHALGTGSEVPAPGYVAVLAVLATLLAPLGLGPGAVVSLLLWLAAPVAGWGAWRLLRVVGHLEDARGAPRWLLALGAGTYALVPLTSGAWAEGRLGTVVAAALLPWLAHAALGFADPEADRRWRAAWRTALLLAVTSAASPVAWPTALLLAVVVLGAAALLAPRAVRAPATWAPPAVALLAVPVLLAPWVVPLLWTGGAEVLLLDLGRLPSPRVGALDLATGRLGGSGAPAWPGLLLACLALLGLVPRRTRVVALLCWLVALAVAALAAALSRVTLDLPGTTTGPGLGFLVVLAQGVLVTAAFTGGLALPALRARARAAAGPRALLLGAPALVALAAAVLVPLAGLGWFLAADDRLEDGADPEVPAYMAQEAALPGGPGVLVVRGDVDAGLRWTVLRGDGLTAGEDEPLVLAAEDRGLTAAVRGLVTSPSPDLVGDLAERGLGYVVLPAPVDGSVAAVLDSATGLEQASAEDRSTRAWAVVPEDGSPVVADAVDREVAWWRWVLLGLQALAVVVVAVLAGPTREGAR